MAATKEGRKAILARIAAFEGALTRAKAYVATGEHGDWHGFRAMFVQKVRAGRELPPHKDWVRSVFIPRTEKTLREAERALKRIDSSSRPRAR